VEKEIGALCFVEHSSDPDVLKTCLRWKTEQYLRTGKPDLFAAAWIRELLARIHLVRSTNFAGMLSALYGGEELMAVHFGMRNGAVWHYWFPAYREEFAKYSPGLLLLLKMAEKSPGMGVSTIDLGQGVSFYKQRLMNHSVPLGIGSVERCTPVTLTRTSFRSLKRFVRRMPLAAPMRRLYRSLNSWNKGSAES
jgi:CelD/BcsL family acetyltransferase involved in cellulose biosynthesis